ncbi:hypothetical protein MMC14_006447 [Varicellaria rhodocarpa]|nr:hypothetical protein [Varicellaria rhodocarpa]
MRLLLIKQDEISILEKQLDRTDVKESKELFLGNCRRDGNSERKQIVRRLETCLAEYDSLVDRSHRILSLSAASERDVESLQNWVTGTSSLAREETAFLDNHNDLLKLVEPADEAISSLEPFIEAVILKFRKWTRQQSQSMISSDPNVFVPSGTRITSISRAVIAWLVIVLLLVPVIILSFVQQLWSRATVIIVAVAIFTMIASALSKARTTEVFAVGATYDSSSSLFSLPLTLNEYRYAAVLVV